MLLREYVYVDPDKISGLAGQLYDGVPERATNIANRQKRVELNVRLVRAGRDTSEEDSVERRLGDSVFKDLEADLESLGLLKDLSDVLSEGRSWDSIDELVKPGQILRLTAPGTIFHPAQLSDTIVRLATAAHGLAGLGLDEEASESEPVIPPRAKTAAQKKADRKSKQPEAPPRFPEDFLPAGDRVPVMDLPREELAGMIRVVRGVFGEGVHLQLRPAGKAGPIVSARLEEGRRFLDSSPEVLIARYGLFEQDWTVVGMVGQLGREFNLNGVSDDIMNEDGTVNRAKFVDRVGEFFEGTAGLVDIPRRPGFSIVPLALYRVIGDPISPD